MESRSEGGAEALNWVHFRRMLLASSVCSTFKIVVQMTESVARLCLLTMDDASSVQEAVAPYTMLEASCNTSQADQEQVPL